MSTFRIYEPRECGPDGYPVRWHQGFIRIAGPDMVWSGWMRNQGAGPQVNENGAFQCGGVKDVVRTQAGDRCVRCAHPYVKGKSGTWDEGHQRLTATLNAPMLDGLERDEVIKAKRATLWSPCDERCTHAGPARIVTADEAKYGDPEWMGRSWEEPPPGFETTTTGGVVAGLVPERARVEAAWRILTVHHLNERKHDLRWWNLVALCQRCHLHIQKKVTMEQVWPLEHSEWFKPYAAGWYAYAYLGEDLSRDETMARLPELLALECVVG